MAGQLGYMARERGWAQAGMVQQARWLWRAGKGGGPGGGGVALKRPRRARPRRQSTRVPPGGRQPGERASEVVSVRAGGRLRVGEWEKGETHGGAGAGVDRVHVALDVRSGRLELLLPAPRVREVPLERGRRQLGAAERGGQAVDLEAGGVVRAFELGLRGERVGEAPLGRPGPRGLGVSRDGSSVSRPARERGDERQRVPQGEGSEREETHTMRPSRSSDREAICAAYESCAAWIRAISCRNCARSSWSVLRQEWTTRLRSAVVPRAGRARRGRDALELRPGRLEIPRGLLDAGRRRRERRLALLNHLAHGREVVGERLDRGRVRLDGPGRRGSPAAREGEGEGVSTIETEGRRRGRT